MVQQAVHQASLSDLSEHQASLSEHQASLSEHQASLSELLAEFTGTMFLALVVGLGGDAVSIGGTLAALVYALGDISGGHFNPAVTFAMLCRGGNWSHSIAFVLAQLSGAFTAAFFSKHVRKEMNSPGVYPRRSTQASIITAVAMEFLFTFVFVFVIVRVTAESRKPNSYYGAAIGLILAAAATVAAPISGAAFNPAIGVALPMANGAYDDVWLYIVGPLMGAGAAVVSNATVFRNKV